MEERRKLIRRQADRDLYARAQGLQEMVDRRGSMGSDGWKHKRRHIIRHVCRISIEVIIRHSAGYLDTWSADVMSVKGRLLDLSAGGASLFTHDSLDIGQELQLSILLPEDKPIPAKAVVRWVKALPEKNGYGSGVQFVGITGPEQNRIQRFLDKLDATAGL